VDVGRSFFGDFYQRAAVAALVGASAVLGD
jgi:hypothetical protein